MTITWCGALAVLLKSIKETIYQEEKITNCSKDQIKRLGVYYMCIDDLPL